MKFAGKGKTFEAPVGRVSRTGARASRSGRDDPACRLCRRRWTYGYLAGFHAVQAFIFERHDRGFKTHKGVQGEFGRLVNDDPRFDPELRAFLSRTYTLKTIADKGNRLNTSADSRRRPPPPPGPRLRAPGRRLLWGRIEEGGRAQPRSVRAFPLPHCKGRRDPPPLPAPTKGG